MPTNLPNAALMQAWHVADTPEIELTNVLGTHFQGCREESPTEIVYPREGPAAVTLIYQGGRLIDFAPGPSLSESDVTEIAAHIANNLLIDVGSIVCRRILFSSLPIVGWWRRGDGEQILPVPPDAPRAPQLFADHPFILEFRVRNSPDPTTLSIRQGVRSSALIRILSLVLEGGVRELDQRSHWVLEPSEPGGASVIAFRQGYYWPDSMVARAQELTDVGTLEPIGEVDSQEYFSRQGLRMGGLSIPSGLANYLSDYDRLEENDRAKFDRACHWFSAAALNGASLSVSLVALVSAVEALEPDQALPRCDKCQAIIEITKRFKEFVEEFAPVQGVEDNVHAKLYNLRSRISHGSMLLRPDSEMRWASLHPLAIEHRSDAANAMGLVRTVLVNWLRSKGSASIVDRSEYVRFRAMRGKSFSLTTTLGTTPKRLI